MQQRDMFRVTGDIFVMVAGEVTRNRDLEQEAAEQRPRKGGEQASVAGTQSPLDWSWHRGKGMAAPVVLVPRPSQAPGERS